MPFSSEKELALKKIVDKILQKFRNLFDHRLCTALTLSYSSGLEGFDCNTIFNAFSSILPGVQKIPYSFYSWMHPELPYLFCYLEVRKLRGKDLSINRQFKSEVRHLKIALFAPLFLTSCQKQSKKDSQMLYLNFQEGDLPTLHPHFIEGHTRGRILGKALFEGLTRFNSKGEIELAGAESIKTSVCQTQYIFTLRDHQWSDGSTVTAFQYEKAWKQAIDPTSGSPRADLFYLIEGAKKAKEGINSLEEVGVKALNDKTLSVKLAFPAPYFLKLISSPIFAPVESTETEPDRFNGLF